MHYLEISWDLDKRPKAQWFFYVIRDGGARISSLDSHRIEIQDEL